MPPALPLIIFAVLSCHADAMLRCLFDAMLMPPLITRSLMPLIAAAYAMFAAYAMPPRQRHFVFLDVFADAFRLLCCSAFTPLPLRRFARSTHKCAQVAVRKRCYVRRARVRAARRVQQRCVRAMSRRALLFAIFHFHIFLLIRTAR